MEVLFKLIKMEPCHCTNVLIYDELDQAYTNYKFKINNQGFIDVIIDGRLTDELRSFGKVTDKIELLRVIDYFLTKHNFNYIIAT